MRCSYESGGNAYQLSICTAQRQSCSLCLLLIVYFRGQVNHFPNPFAKKNLVYRHPAQAKGILFGKKFGLLGLLPRTGRGAYSCTGAVWHRQDKCFADSTLRMLAGYGAGGGYFRRYFSECQHAQQNCIRPDVRKLHPV